MPFALAMLRKGMLMTHQLTVQAARLLMQYLHSGLRARGDGQVQQRPAGGAGGAGGQQRGHAARAPQRHRQHIRSQLGQALRARVLEQPAQEPHRNLTSPQRPSAASFCQSHEQHGHVQSCL